MSQTFKSVELKKLHTDIFGNEVSQQSAKVIWRFGGVMNLAHWLTIAGCKISRIAIYRWTYRSGLIPPDRLPYVKKAARLAGLTLTEEDLKP